ncbi:allene oxide synthase-lipoxygenase protein-like [Actinia tenebrosa]|uniref:Allene oxide synthase-lipoxygenase protein-like n=1 Tax=Actinia tenebrosa TaxID=6105 RepID=A0A6P8J1I0_ACTTE|nr:allene oxide synthase-lipoxygenase protein-like [Actinia tenebrosa]
MKRWMVVLALVLVLHNSSADTDMKNTNDVTQEAEHTLKDDIAGQEQEASGSAGSGIGAAVQEGDGPNNCAKSPCKNSGTCINDYNRIDGYRCQCQDDFGGINCEELKCRISLASYASKICLVRREIGRKAKKMLIKLTSSRKEDFLNNSDMHVPLLLKKGAASFVQSASTDPFTIEWYMKMTDNADLNKDIESHFTLKDSRFHTTPTLLDFAIVYEAFYKHHKKRSAMSALKRVPAIEDNFFKDRCFADQRLAGANPFQIWKVTREAGNEGVSWERLYETYLNKDFDWHKAFRKVLNTDDNDALDKAIDKAEVLVVYYPELEGIEPPQLNDVKFNHTVLPLTAPIAFFITKEYEPGVRRLSPVAIQLNMDNTSSVFTPDDEKSWFFAKSAVQRADFNVLHIVKKRLKTHLYMDAPCTLVEKYFSEYHPLHQILRHHCRASLETNKLFELKLYGPKAPIYKALSIDYKTAVKMLNEQYNKMDFDDIDLLKDLQKRGVMDKKTLPYYPYRDDGVKLYDTIKTFIKDYLQLYYKKDEDITKDYELQEFANEMSIDGKNEDGGLGMVRKFPAKIENLDQLTGVLSTFIWVLTGQHAAVTYPILEYGGFVPNAPHRLFADSEGKSKFSNSMFGNKAIALEVAELCSNIGSIHLDQLFDYYNKIEDEQGKVLVQKFYDDLDNLSKKILDDNDQRVRDGFLPYPYFLPGYVTNSIST